MSPEQAPRPVKRAVFGFALAVPLLAGCAYDDGYYDDGYYGRPDYGYGYGYYGYSYGYPCGWPYDCDRWHHRRHHRRHHHDHDDGRHDDGDDSAGGPAPEPPGGQAPDVPRRPRFVDLPDADSPRFPGRIDRQPAPQKPQNRIWLPPARDSRR